MPRPSREQLVALAILVAALLAALAVPTLALLDRVAAAQERSEQGETLSRLLARARTQGAEHKVRKVEAAPAEAFLSASSMGLAGGDLQAYVERLASQHAAIVSIAVQQSAREDPPDTIRVEASLELDLGSLQTLLYELESGVPYVFVDALSIRSASGEAAPSDGGTLHVTLGLRGLWRKTSA